MTGIVPRLILFVVWCLEYDYDSKDRILQVSISEYFNS